MNRIPSRPPRAPGGPDDPIACIASPSVATSYPEIRGSAGPGAHLSAPARALCAPVPVTPP